MYQRRLQIPLSSSLLMVLYTEISELFCTSFRLALVSKILLKTLSECESRIVGRSPNFINTVGGSEIITNRNGQSVADLTALRMILTVWYCEPAESHGETSWWNFVFCQLYLPWSFFLLLGLCSMMCAYSLGLPVCKALTSFHVVDCFSVMLRVCICPHDGITCQWEGLLNPKPCQLSLPSFLHLSKQVVFFFFSLRLSVRPFALCC